MLTRLRHAGLGGLALGVSLVPDRRRLFATMRRYVRDLPQALAGPLPAALAAQTPAQTGLALPPGQVRLLADAAALFERRSLVRYHFMRQAGVPLVLNFGARFVAGAPDRDITGHAWVTLDGAPYFEDGENYKGFVVMLKYPD